MTADLLLHVIQLVLVAAAGYFWGQHQHHSWMLGCWERLQEIEKRRGVTTAEDCIEVFGRKYPR